jgi:hypothetical protein
VVEQQQLELVLELQALGQVLPRSTPEAPQQEPRWQAQPNSED